MVKVDQETCIGCGACSVACEKIFEMKDGKAHVKTGKENSSAECIKEAIESCPIDAIS